MDNLFSIENDWQANYGIPAFQNLKPHIKENILPPSPPPLPRLLPSPPQVKQPDNLLYFIIIFIFIYLMFIISKKLNKLIRLVKNKQPLL